MGFFLLFWYAWLGYVSQGLLLHIPTSGVSHPAVVSPRILAPRRGVTLTGLTKSLLLHFREEVEQQNYAFKAKGN